MSEEPHSEPRAPGSDAAPVAPPTHWTGTLRHLGPGLIIAGSIVGSGELIATTKTGAQAGMTLLWLILLGCVIKVFVQIEMGRYTITSGETSLAGLNRVPGPRLRVNWILWYWLLMTIAGLGQLGGIVGGVGQSFALSLPITGDYLRAVESVGEVYTWDDKYWAIAVTAATIAMLIRGRYGMIQAVSTALVASFTFLTLGNVLSLQFTQEWALSGDEVLRGLKFALPRDENGQIGVGLTTALATFGIIGVGASELIAYPYWCLEKGYARFAGPRNEEASWAQRASGWIQVMRYDALLSMVVYTFATLVFYILGATVLHRLPDGAGDPEGMRMVATLAEAFVPVFGTSARLLFLVGAVAVLYSTFFVAIAGAARVDADALVIFKLQSDDPALRRRAISVFCVVLPLISVSVFLSGANPVTLILTSGVMQSIMLPMLGGAALWFRYHASDHRLLPGRVWDAFLWLSMAGLLLAGGSTAFFKLRDFVG